MQLRLELYTYSKDYRFLYNYFRGFINLLFKSNEKSYAIRSIFDLKARDWLNILKSIIWKVKIKLKNR